MSKKKKKTIKIPVIDYEKCWNEYKKMTEMLRGLALIRGNLEAANGIKIVLNNLEAIEKKHTKFQTIQ